MTSLDSTRKQVQRWETLNREILVLIFAKLSISDLTKRASRVCISWFLASHDKTLWNTVDIDKLRQVEEGLSPMNIFRKISKFFFDFCEVRTTLTNITKFSSTTPKNLFFSFNSFVAEGDIMVAAMRMPNIEKLVLPRWCCEQKTSFQFAFSTWKNLKTLIISHDYRFTGQLVFQAVGENCSNLTNLKYLGQLEDYTAGQIVSCLKNLKRLSLRCSFVKTTGVLLLITGLQSLLTLNLPHCKNLSRYRDPLPIDDHVQAAAQKLEKFITCTQGCSFCKEQRGLPWSKHWRDDEIDELEF